ncbi:MAG: GYF domain-containing protein [Verrucomicrobiales bacterium]|nr:GYF domain-containing protein [Verrucomicrobiales bacterium]
MTDQYYYMDAANQNIGPLSWDVIEQLHGAGTLNDGTLVAQEGASDWITFAEAKTNKENRQALPPVPGKQAQGGSSGLRETSRGRKKSSRPRRAVIKVIVICTALLLIIGALFLIPRGGSDVISPKRVDPGEIAGRIEAMPPIHLPAPGSPVDDPDYMRLVTGENTVQVRAIPDQPDLYQIDVTRYGVIYGMLNRPKFHRDLLTVLLTLGTRFEKGEWVLLEGKGGAHHSISRPGDISPEVTTIENLPQDEIRWHGQFIIDYLNGVTPDAHIEALSASEYDSLHSAFEKDQRLRSELRMRGIPQPK